MQTHELLAELGNCREVEPNTMYPEPGAEREEAIAVAVCIGCRVMDECLEYSLDNREVHGVWAGRTETERIRLSRKIRTEHRRGKV
jgi:WhiB family transcriptional regulator, redox-sensing transcriptional regulator